MIYWAFPRLPSLCVYAFLTRDMSCTGHSNPPLVELREAFLEACRKQRKRFEALEEAWSCLS